MGSGSVPLAEIIDYFQRRPEALEPGATALELKETHISYVLLSPTRVYKFKKAVKFAFIDQLSLEERARNCEREVELNGRLAADVYLGIRGVFAEGDGFVLAEATRGSLEYCVVMRRLPDERSFKSMLERGEATEEDVTRIARVIGDFHQACARGSRITERRTFRKFLIEDLAVLEQSGAAGNELIEGVQSVLGRNSFALHQREVRERIVDGHGDLRLDHIYILDEGIRIIDCVEFSAPLRAVDPYEDLAFTSMSLRVQGRDDLADRLVADYASWTTDFSGLRLLPLFEMYRASVRAKIDWFQFQQVETNGLRDYYQRRFFGYLGFMQGRLAAEPARGGRISVVMGLPATGKSTFARNLQDRGSAAILSSDVIRKRMLRLNPDQEAGSTAFAGAYGGKATARVYRRMHALAKLALHSGFDVILDATFGKRRYRRLALDLARKMKAEIVFYLLRADEEVVQRRLELRRVHSGVSDLVDLAIWERLKDGFEEFTPEELQHARLEVRRSSAGVESG